MPGSTSWYEAATAVELAYDTRGRAGGDAPTVVLVHGWAGNRTYWASQIDLLAQRHQVVVLDLGGHGESGFGRDDSGPPAHQGLRRARTAEGLSKPEIMRCLKRYVARELFPLIQAIADPSPLEEGATEHPGIAA